MYEHEYVVNIQLKQQTMFKRERVRETVIEPECRQETLIHVQKRGHIEHAKLM